MGSIVGEDGLVVAVVRSAPGDPAAGDGDHDAGGLLQLPRQARLHKHRRFRIIKRPDHRRHHPPVPVRRRIPPPNHPTTPPLHTLTQLLPRHIPIVTISPTTAPVPVPVLLLLLLPHSLSPFPHFPVTRDFNPCQIILTFEQSWSPFRHSYFVIRFPPTFRATLPARPQVPAMPRPPFPQSPQTLAPHRQIRASSPDPRYIPLTPGRTTTTEQNCPFYSHIWRDH